MEQQLKDQNAEKFYPIYEQMINDMYNNRPTINNLKASIKKVLILKMVELFTTKTTGEQRLK